MNENPWIGSPATSRAVLAVIVVMLTAATVSPAAAWSVLTFHYDTFRTGWNRHETSLTPKNVSGPQFGLLHQVPLDAQADAQPLFVPGLVIDNRTRDVVFAATENDTIYAIDAASGERLLARHLGPPVPISQIPENCNNNGEIVGINSTPVIDPSTSTLYVIAFTYVNNSTPTWILHALDLATLQDKTYSPVVVRAAAALAGGSTYSFNPAVSRQRAALLEANGNIYAGFSSFCDFDASASRGWVLGWQAATLTPLPAGRLIDKHPNSAVNFFLSSVWMSGDGIAADAAGNLFFVTGNSDPSGTSYGPIANPSESVIALSPDLARVERFFTPSDANYGVQVLDRDDLDFGSGGIMLLPYQPGSAAPLAVAAGKAGQMYLLDRYNLGGYSSDGVNRVLGTYPIGACWCGESYFRGADGVGRVVSSGSNQMKVWTVRTSPPGLAFESRPPALPQSAQDGGFFTSVSSNGRQNPIIWAVGRPIGGDNDDVRLYAYDPSAPGKWLYAGTAGTWPNLGGNANIVPVVADGRVYVASYRELDIFGLGADTAAARPLAAHPAHPEQPPRWPLPAGSHEVYGTIETIGAGKITLATRTGALVPVAVTAAIDAGRSLDFLVGRTVRVIGRYDRAHVLQANSIIKAKRSPLAWPTDR